MSLERVIRALVNLGLKTSDAEVYVYLTKKGPQTMMNLEQSLNYSENQISSSLNVLLIRKLVTQNENTFYPILFEEALDLLLDQEREETQRKQYCFNLISSKKSAGK